MHGPPGAIRRRPIMRVVAGSANVVIGGVGRIGERCAEQDQEPSEPRPNAAHDVNSFIGFRRGPSLVSDRDVQPCSDFRSIFTDVLPAHQIMVWLA